MLLAGIFVLEKEYFFCQKLYPLRGWFIFKFGLCTCQVQITMIIAAEIYYYTVPTQNHIIVPFLNWYFIGSDNDELIRV